MRTGNILTNWDFTLAHTQVNVKFNVSKCECVYVWQVGAEETTGEKTRPVLRLLRETCLSHWTLPSPKLPRCLHEHTDKYTVCQRIHTRTTCTQLHKQTDRHMRVHSQFMIPWHTLHWELQCAPLFCHSPDSEPLSDLYMMPNSELSNLMWPLFLLCFSKRRWLYAFAAKLTRVTSWT